VDEDDGLGFDSQPAMMGQDVEEMDPVSAAVFVGRAARGGMGDEAEGNAALAIIMDGAETDFVITFVDGTVVDKFRRVHKVIAVHATTS
jgi:hypothetical protein